MELPSFDLLWDSSKKLLELESVLEKIDQHEVQKTFSSKKRPRRDGLFGIGFEIEDRSYYEPQHYCCDQAFYTEAAYTAHVSDHTQCEVAGCSFVAHPNAMRLHKEVVHDSGYFEKIFGDITNKSVIQWREARKKNYPTLERAAVKQEILSERLARGQVFKTQEFGTFNRRRAPVITSTDILQSSSVATVSSSTDPTVAEVDAQLEAETASTSHSLSPKVTDTPNASALRLVAVDYNSETEEHAEDSSPLSSDENHLESEPESTHPDIPDLPETENQSPLALNRSRSVSPCQNPLEPHSDDDDKPNRSESESVPQRGRRRRRGGRRRRQRIEQHNRDLAGEIDDADNQQPDALHHDSQSPPEASSKLSSDPFASHPVVQLRAKRRACLSNPERIHSRPTLLHMLLAEEMRTERNQLMQCVRYVIKNNFFLDEPKSKSDG